MAGQGQSAEAQTALDHADQLMPAALHLLTDADRIDRDRARAYVS